MRTTGKSVIFVPSDASLTTTVELMIKQDISSVLVTGAGDAVLGIVTERDLVRKVLLLDVATKLERKVTTIMSRPVEFVRLAHLENDLAAIHLKCRYRHFPVLAGELPVKAGVVGMLTATDVVRQFATQSLAKPATPADRPMLALLCADPFTAVTLTSLLEGLGYQVLAGEAEVVMKAINGTATPLLYDLDGFTGMQNGALLKAARRHAGLLMLCTSELRLVGPFRKRFDPQLQHVILKPLDISYVLWLLRSFYDKAPGSRVGTSAA